MTELSQPADKTEAPIPEVYKEFPLFLHVFRACHELRGHLPPATGPEGMLAFPSQRSDPKKEYLLLCLDEIEKILYKTIGIFSNEGYKMSATDSELAVKSIRDDQAGWKRKLIELLIELTSFQSVNDQLYFRHLLSIREYQSLNNVWRDWKEFYGCTNRSHLETLKLLDQNISKTEEYIDISKCWYLKQPASLWKARKQKSKRNAFPSFSMMLRNAHSKLHPMERLFIGLTYNSGYGVTSSQIHSNVGGRRSAGDNIEPSISGNITESLLGCLHCIARITRLLALEDTVSYRALIEEMATNDYGQALYNDHVDAGVAVGEVAQVPGGLALVMKINESLYGYKSYQVTYSGKPMIEGIFMDTFIAPHVSARFTQDQVAEGFLKKHHTLLGDMIEHLSKEELRDIGKEAIHSTITTVLEREADSDPDYED